MQFLNFIMPKKMFETFCTGCKKCLTEIFWENKHVTKNLGDSWLCLFFIVTIFAYSKASSVDTVQYNWSVPGMYTPVIVYLAFTL